MLEIKGLSSLLAWDTFVVNFIVEVSRYSMKYKTDFRINIDIFSSVTKSETTVLLGQETFSESSIDVKCAIQPGA